MRHLTFEMKQKRKEKCVGFRRKKQNAFFFLHLKKEENTEKNDFAVFFLKAFRMGKKSLKNLSNMHALFY